MSEELIRKPSVTGVTSIPNKDGEFFRAWLEVMRPLHNLASKEMDFAAALLKKRYEIAKTTSDSRTVDKLLFDAETKRSVAESLNISYSYMQYVLKKMRGAGIIKGKTIDPQYLPAYEEGKPVRWMFIFQNNAAG